MKQETTNNNSPGRTLAHLLGFGLLLALILMVIRGTPMAGGATDRVIFTEVDLKQVAARHTRTWNRPPTAEELRKAMEQYVREEILYREALARKFDRDDPTVRLAMVRKVMMLGTARVEAMEPSDKELQAYFSLRKERYRIPAVVDLIQVFISTDKRGDKARGDAEQLLTKLRERDPKVDELNAYGDSIMLANVQVDMSEPDLDRTFGNGFSSAVIALEPGQWAGPIESGYGLHLVKVLKRDDATIPDWTDVRHKLITDIQFEARKAAEDQLYAEIAPRYQIIYDDAVAGVLEGATQ
ncbi:MAG: peptidyl-prolyl cis-trans isomerase [Planctomycetota bacterium]|jgi:hypothetical protein